MKNCNVSGEWHHQMHCGTWKLKDHNCEGKCVGVNRYPNENDDFLNTIDVHFKRHFERCLLSCIFEKKKLWATPIRLVCISKDILTGDRNLNQTDDFLISSWVWDRAAITWTCFVILQHWHTQQYYFKKNVQSTSSCKHYNSARMHVRCRYCARSKHGE